MRAAFIARKFLKPLWLASFIQLLHQCIRKAGPLVAEYIQGTGALMPKWIQIIGVAGKRATAAAARGFA